MGFVILVALGFYLLISIGVVVWAVRHARRVEKSASRWGWSAALVMYLIPFWDLIPTVVMHRYYCETEAGFWVYKTVEQWKKENPEEARGWVEDKTPHSTRVGNDENHVDTQVLNPRFQWTTEKRRVVALVPVYRWEREISDSVVGDVVARHIDLSAGKGRDSLKFWLNVQACPGGMENRNALYRFVETVVNVNKEDAK